MTQSQPSIILYQLAIPSQLPSIFHLATSKGLPKRQSVFETKAFVFGIIKHYSSIWWFVFFPLIKKALFLFVCLSLFFFKGTRIVSWLLFKCALTRWIKWHQYYKCIIVCIAINYVTFSGCFVKKLNRTSWTEQGLKFWHLDLSIYFYVSCLPLAQNLKRKFSTVEFCCCISS